MRLGLFGGTYDPPHIGHLIVAQDAVEALRLDRLIFVPAAVPPHKRRAGITDAKVRFDMVRLAIAGDGRFAVDDIELQRAGPSYTADTVRAYRERFPEAQLYLLMGADQYAEFDTWREPEVIRSLATIAVLRRSGHGDIEGAGDGHGGVVRIAVTRIDLSSTDIRRRTSTGEPIRYLVPDGVERLIHERGLYRPPGGADAPNRTAAAG